MSGRMKIFISIGVAAGFLIAGGCVAWIMFFQRPLRVAEPVKRSAPVQQPASIPKETPKEHRAMPDKQNERVEPIMTPKTVYSGTLGEVTGLQAGRDISKIAFEMREYQLKLQELENKMNAPVIIPPAPAPIETEIMAPTPSGQAVPIAEGKSRLVVMAVRGYGSALTATLRSSSGTFTVRTGDNVPGFGKVKSISQERVVVGSAAVPWL